MIQVTPQMRVLVATEPVDGRKGIDGLVRLCKSQLGEDPYSGCLFLFRNRSGQSIRLMIYDGQGFWLAQKRLSSGRFTNWPKANHPHSKLQAHQVYLLCMAGDPATTSAPMWKALPNA
jgi:transposase